MAAVPLHMKLIIKLLLVAEHKDLTVVPAQVAVELDILLLKKSAAEILLQ